MAKKGKLKKIAYVEENSRPFRPRKYDFFMLIVCEDEKTEPYYFKQFKKLFPPDTVYLREIGTGKKPKGIVEQTIIEREKLSLEAKKSIDEVWVVFDKDDEGNNATTLTSFTNAWDQATTEKIKIAFSNEVFELWLLLHFIDIVSSKPIPRLEVYSLLGKQINSYEPFKSFVYDHKKADPEIIIGAATNFGSETKATERADKLLIEQKNKKPIEANPSTTVHILVKRLRELVEWYSYSSG